MRIAQVAPLYEAVPPRYYGGAERVVAYLTDELVRRGHDVVLFANAESRTCATLVPISRHSLRYSCPKEEMAYLLSELGEVFERAEEFDLIHCHVDFPALPFAKLVKTPVVHTLHGRLDLAELPIIFRRYARQNFISISDNQRQPLSWINWIATVYHGLPLSLYTYNDCPEDYLLFLGRLCPEKRPELAIEVAKRLGIKLKIAAKVDPADQLYFEREIRPLMCAPWIEYLGEVDDEEKNYLLGHAQALLFPIDWPEPFGIVAIEALACGTPVITRPCGSMPELIASGRTGFLAREPEELMKAVRQINQIDRRECRREFERRFTTEAMVDKYVKSYQEVMVGTLVLTH